MVKEIKMKKVMVGMSGGVDSSVAAMLLRDSGFEVMGVTLKLFSDEDIVEAQKEGKTCCALSDVMDARSVAYRLGFEHIVFNFKDCFRERVMSQFADSYMCGRTPNPCIECNRYVKFDKMLRRGLRQSDAVFHHTKQLPEIVEALFLQQDFGFPHAVGVSSRPRNLDGSYMPCFLCGEGFARSYAAINRITVYRTSHQVGHILAALYSADRLDLVNERFIAFHVSGGTTDCLISEPNENEVIKLTEIATSLDLKAGQAVDRVGVMLGLRFPCGAELEKLAVGSDKSFRIKPVIRDGNCSLSGIENKCRARIEKGESRENTAKFCLDSVGAAIEAMAECAVEKYGSLPIIFAGGVMSDVLIKERLLERFPQADFAQPQFSCDNAAGTAIYAYLKHIGEK